MTPQKVIEITSRIEESARAVRQPLARASHVPYRLYSDPEVLELEKERLFMKDWIIVGREEQIAKAGDYMTLDLFGEPVVIARNNVGQINAFPNFCLHRGAEISAKGFGNTQEFTCPYHAVLQQPQRAERLVMIGSTGLAPTPAARAQGFRDWIMHLTPDAHRPKLQNVFTDKALATEDMVVEDVLFNTSPAASACFDKFLTYMAGPINDDLVLERLPAIAEQVPLLLFWGVDDTSVSVDIGRAARDKLPRSRLVTVEHLNHTPYYENPPLFNEVLLKFIAGQLDEVQASGLTLR